MRPHSSRPPSACALTPEGMAELVGHVPDVGEGVRLEVVLLQELEGVLAQELKGDAHVAMEVEPVRHQHTQAGERTEA